MVPPDMWWFSPHVNLKNGQALPATDVVESHSRPQLATLVETLQQRDNGSLESMVLRAFSPLSGKTWYAVCRRYADDRHLSVVNPDRS